MFYGHHSREMGQRQSSALPSREEILAKTRGGRDLVDQIFNWMIQNVQLKELYALANPDRCKEYIFLTADALDVLFKKVAIEPKEGPKGVVYFQKIDDLVRSKTPDDPRAVQRQRICVKLAFLYVRIFQVFAALAISILDVDTKTELQFYEGLRRLQQDDNVPLFARGKRGGALAQGYPLSDDLLALRPYLNTVEGTGKYYRFGTTSVYLEWDNTTLDGTKLLFEYRDKLAGGKVKNIEARLQVSGRDTAAVTLLLSNIKDDQGVIAASETLHFTRSGIGGQLLRRGQPIPQALEAFFNTVISQRKARATTGQPYAYDQPARASDRDSSGVSEGLHTKTLLEAFRQTPPVKAHCVARALQLLSEAGLQKSVPAEVYSSVCKLRFMADNRTLPAANEGLTKSYGMYALAQLFYDTLPGISPAMAAQTEQQYRLFLEQMKFVFEEKKTTGAAAAAAAAAAPTPSAVRAASGKKESLSDVRNKLPSGVCDTSRMDRSLAIRNRDLIRQLRVDAARMIQYQITHTANAVKVLQQLFLLPVQAGERLRVHPNVLKNGLSEVNRIAEVARNLLIDYYSQCEIMYRHGAELLANPAYRQEVRIT